MAKNEKQSSNEREHPWQHDELVQMGEEFLLFDPNRQSTQIRHTDDGLFAGLKSSIRLETGVLGKLTLSLVASPYTKERSAVLTPFDRAQGYPLDQEDLSAPRRMAKMHRIKRELTGTLQGLYLFAFVTYEAVKENALVQAFLQEDWRMQESEQALRLRRLFLTLKFPGGAAFTAQAQFNMPQTFLLFRTFFPSDTGPLPHVGRLSSSVQTTVPEHIDNGEPSHDRSEGFDLLVPFDLAKLQAIRAQLLFLATQGG